MFGITINSRRSGKQYAGDMAMRERLKKGETVVYLGIDTPEKAERVRLRLFNNHGVDTIYEPMYVSQQPKPIFDMTDLETPIIGYDYPPKKLTGYSFKLKV